MTRGTPAPAGQHQLASTSLPAPAWAQSTAASPSRGLCFEPFAPIHAFMINKRTGQAVYAILTIGGFLGLGKAYYPIPFRLLAFEPTTDSYVVTIDRRVLEGGPSWANNAPLFDQAYADRVASYYEVAKEDLTLG